MHDVINLIISIIISIINIIISVNIWNVWYFYTYTFILARSEKLYNERERLGYIKRNT